MKVIDVMITSRFQGNGRPAGGYAEFDDGKTYYFGPRVDRVDGVLQTVGYSFTASRRTQAGTHERVNFEAPKREAALKAYLDAV